VTGQDRIHDDPIARLEALDVLAGLLNKAPEFMPLDGGELDTVMELPPVNVQIRAANSRMAVLHQYLVGPDVRLGRVAHANVSIPI